MGKDVQLVKVDSATLGPARVKSLDVIFIHGLGGDHVETWKPPSGDTWPQRVANADPDVQVWSLDYPAKIGQLFSLGKPDQPDTHVLADLATKRMINKDIGAKRPCILVCHSLGGLLAKRILFDAWQAEKSGGLQFRHDRVKAVMFCGTPHRGSAIANVLRWAECAKDVAPNLLMTYFGWDHGRYANKIAGCLGVTSDLIKELERNNIGLQHLNEDFRSYYQHRAAQGFMVDVYAETKGMKFKGVSTAMVVPTESANPYLRLGNGPELPVYQLPDKDHSELVKPASDSDWVVEGLDVLIRRVKGSEHDLELHGALHRRVGLLIHAEIFKCPELLKLSCFRSMIDEELNVADASLRVARRFAETEGDALTEYLLKLPPVFDELSSYRDHAKVMHDGLSKIGCVLMLAIMRRHLPERSIDDHSPGIEVPNLGETEQLDLMIEVLHASFRNWPVKLALSADRARVTPGSLIFRQAGTAPGSWNVEHHVRHLVDRILARRPITARALSGVASESMPDEDTAAAGVVDESRLTQARTLLRSWLAEQLGLVLHAQNKDSLYAQEHVRQRIDQAFGGLIALVLPATDDTVPPELQTRLDELQIIAQQFMLKVQDTRP